MLVGTALYIRLLLYVGLSLFIISGLYVYMVVCVVYAYNLTHMCTCDSKRSTVCIFFDRGLFLSEN